MCSRAVAAESEMKEAMLQAQAQAAEAERARAAAEADAAEAKRMARELLERMSSRLAEVMEADAKVVAPKT